jgi:hypothetical protein
MLLMVAMRGRALSMLVLNCIHANCPLERHQEAFEICFRLSSAQFATLTRAGWLLACDAHSMAFFWHSCYQERSTQ